MIVKVIIVKINFRVQEVQSSRSSRVQSSRVQKFKNYDTKRFKKLQSVEYPQKQGSVARAAPRAERQEFFPVQGNGVGLSGCLPTAENVPSEVQANDHPHHHRAVGTTQRERHAGVYRQGVPRNGGATTFHPEHWQPPRR